MHWLQTLDAGLFHVVNPTLSNSFFDVLMPFCSGNAFFGPAFLLAVGLLAWKGGARGRICVLMLVLAIALGDSFVCNTLKHLISRPRPFWTIPDAHVPTGIGRTDSGSMPSSHAANWFAATMVLFIYYRRSIRFMLPMALLVSFSRIYNGVHYPADVLVGAILGAGYAACGVWTLDALWRWAGRRWFPLWWAQVPSLLDPSPSGSRSVAGQSPKPDPRLLDQHWMRLGYVLIFVELVINLGYIASGKIGLSEDEAYQWIWSKHLALSYYSKPPLIAITQFLGTSLWGDTVFGVRFFSPVISAVLSILLLRFMARVANVRAAFWLSLIIPTVPLAALGSILMTIDPLSVMFWALAMMAGWRAIQDNSTTRDWFWVGLWMGLGFLSKYTALFQLLSWAVLFAVWPPARKQLRRPGPYVALLVNLLCTIPVLIWNSQHAWITVRHVSEGGHLDKPWAFTGENLWRGFSVYTRDFFFAELGLQNPFFFLPLLWAAVVFWRRKPKDPLLLYFFSMGAPLFLCYFLFTFHSRVLPNWIAPSILPLFCLAVVYWEQKWRAGSRAIRFWLWPGLIFGLFAVVILHDTRLLGRVIDPSLVAKAVAQYEAAWHKPGDRAINLHPRPIEDPTDRVLGWAETAQTVEAARQKLKTEGRPVFIIGGHYGITGEITFNLPEARAAVRDHPIVYYLNSKTPDNQFYFWPSYGDRKGQNAIFVETLDLNSDKINDTPKELVAEFESVTSLGAFVITHDGQPVRRIQITECRGLR